MSALDTVVEVWPARTEVAVVHLPVEGVAHVHRLDGTVVHLLAGDFACVSYPDGAIRLLSPLLPGTPLVAIVAGDADLIGWGATVLGETLATVRNNRHRLDRPVWHQAARAVKGGGVVYVQLEQRDYYGKPRWTAVGLRGERGAA